jgi:hypothetical protein
MPKHKTELDKMFNEFEFRKKNRESIRDLFYRAECATGNLEKPPTLARHMPIFTK